MCRGCDRPEEVSSSRAGRGQTVTCSESEKGRSSFSSGQREKGGGSHRGDHHVRASSSRAAGSPPLLLSQPPWPFPKKAGTSLGRRNSGCGSGPAHRRFSAPHPLEQRLSRATQSPACRSLAGRNAAGATGSGGAFSSGFTSATATGAEGSADLRKTPGKEK